MAPKKHPPTPAGSGITRFCFRLCLLLLLLLLGDDGCLLDSLRWRRRVKGLHANRCGLNALSGDRCRLDPLGADLCRGQTNPVHRHELHVVQVDSGGHAHSSLGGQR